MRVLGLVSAIAVSLSSPSSSPPHIVVHVLDDIGWSDLGFGGAEYATPTLDALALEEGIRLTRYHVQPVCSPTRASLMTGRFPFRFGMQEAVPQACTAALPASQPGARTLAEELTGTHYESAMLGKWHMGYSTWADTPTGRGFAQHIGYFQGEEDYYNHTFCSQTCVFNGSDPSPLLGRCGLDFWDGRVPLRPMSQSSPNYSTHIYRDAAVDIIEKHAAATPAPTPAPLFLYAGAYVR